MRYRPLGRTGLRVSEIGFGCGNVGGLIIRAPLEERIAAVKHAIELGINYFDTAAQYGNGQSEKNLGEVLGILKPAVTVATKFGLGQEDLKDVRGAVRRSLEDSLKRLAMESVDIFQLHTPLVHGSGSSRGVSLEAVLGPGGVADALDNLRSEGLIRFAGFTGLGETEALHDVVRSRRFDLLQAYFNLLNPSAAVTVPENFSGQNFGGLIGEAAQIGMGVVAIRVLAGGALGGEVARTGYASPSVGGALAVGAEYELELRRASRLGFLVNGDLLNLSRAGIRFVLGDLSMSTALVGFSSVAQIEEAVACSDRGPLSQADLRQMREVWASNFGL